jgi:hypothetical protein
MIVKPTGPEHTMPKSTTTRHDCHQEHQGGMFADVLNNSEQPCDDALDFFISEDRKRPAQASAHEPIPVAGVDSESETQPPIDDLFSLEHPHGTKLSRQAMGVVARVSMERHGWKQTGTRSSLWVFEHRSPHLRDHAEGRNHRLPSD